MSVALPPDVRSANWEFLLRQLTLGEDHAEVTEKIREAAPQELKELLRHHRDGIFSLPSDIAFRARLDRWLARAGMIYLSWLCGYTTVPRGDADRDLLLPVLANPAVRDYYEIHYPVALPWLLRLHLERNLELSSGDTPEGAAAFERFSVLYERFQSDPDLAQFLDFLDGFSYGGDAARVDIRAVVECFGIPDRVALAFAKMSDQVTPLDRGIIGLVRFLAHSEDLDQLLLLCRGLPVIQSGLWFFYAYWFREFRTDVAEASNRALDNAVEAVRSAANPGWADRVSLVTAGLDDWKQKIERLTGGGYAAGLIGAVASARGNSIMISTNEFVFPDEAPVQEWLNRFGAYEQTAQARTPTPPELRRRRPVRGGSREMTPEEKLLRAIFGGQGASEETSTSREAMENPEEEMES
jgi:hypothetical protein